MSSPSIGCGRFHTLVVNDAHQILGWGSNEDLALGVNAARGIVEASNGIVDYPGKGSYPKQIAVGEDHTLILEQGEITSMGSSRDGRIGHMLPCGKVKFPSGTEIAMIAAGARFNLAIDTNRKDMWAWGKGQGGSLGITTFTMSPIKFSLDVKKHSPVVSVAVGDDFSIALTESGHVFTWGVGENGRLGHGDTRTILRPTAITSLVFDRHSKVIQISAGSAHAMALTLKGKVYSWGSGAHGRLGLGNQDDFRTPQPIRYLPYATWISCGNRHSLAVTKSSKDGITLFTWGCGKNGKLGLSDLKGDKVLSPEPVVAFVEMKPQYDVLEACCGPEHTVAIALKSSRSQKDKGINQQNFKIFAWGANTKGACGRNPSTKALIWPMPESLEIKKKGTYLRERLKKLEEKHESGIIRGVHAVNVVAGADHSMARSRDGSVYSWGRGSFGQLGIGRFPLAVSPSRIEFPIQTKISAISCGANHSLAISFGGNLYTWGSNRLGQLGLAHTEDRFKPMIVEALQGTKVVAIAGGGDHSGALAEIPSKSSSGRVTQKQCYLWGSNTKGQLGLGVNDKLFAVPHKIDFDVPREPKTRIEYKLALGLNHTLVLCNIENRKKKFNESRLYACGDNDDFQLGIADCDQGTYQTKFEQLKPSHFEDSAEGDEKSRERKGYIGINLIAAGSNYSLAIVRKSNSNKDTLFAWGVTHGLGKKQASPHKFKEFEKHVEFYCLRELEPGQDNWLHSLKFETISAGRNHVIAIVQINNNRSRRHMFVWGDSSFGKLGIGNVIDALKTEENLRSDFLKQDLGTIGLSPKVLPSKNLAKTSSKLYLEALQGCRGVAAGDSHSLAINQTGALFSWGSMKDGRLGIGSAEDTIGTTVIFPRLNPCFGELSPHYEEEQRPSKQIQEDVKEIGDQKEEQKGVIPDDSLDADGIAFVASTIEDFKAQKKQEIDFLRRMNKDHRDYKQWFFNYCTKFDLREGQRSGARKAIARRLEHQLGASGGEFDQTIFSQIYTQNLNPFEDVLASLYLDPSRMAILFKVLHLNRYTKLKDSKNGTGTMDAENQQNEVDFGDTKHSSGNNSMFKEDSRELKKKDDDEKSFIELIFAVYDLSKPESRRRFQVFFKMILDYLMHPSQSAKTDTDIFRESGLLWQIFRTALCRGRSRVVLTQALFRILSDERISHTSFRSPGKSGGNKNLQVCYPFLTEKAQKELNGGEKSEIKANYRRRDALEQLKARARKLITLLTNENDPMKKGYVKELLQGTSKNSDGIEWLLQIVYYCVESRANQMRVDAKARLKSMKIDEKFVNLWQKNILRRSSRAALKALIFVAIETIGTRRTRQAFIRNYIKLRESKEGNLAQMNPADKQIKWEKAKIYVEDILGYKSNKIGEGLYPETENLLLHALLGEPYLSRYIDHRKREDKFFCYVPKGSTKTDIKMWTQPVSTDNEDLKGFSDSDSYHEYRYAKDMDAKDVRLGDITNLASSELHAWMTEGKLVKEYDKDLYDRKRKSGESASRSRKYTPTMDAYMDIISRRKTRHAQHMKNLFTDLLKETISSRTVETERIVGLSRETQSFLRKYCCHKNWRPLADDDEIKFSLHRTFRLLPFYKSRTRRLVFNPDCFVWHPIMPQVIAENKLNIFRNAIISVQIKNPSTSGGGTTDLLQAHQPGHRHLMEHKQVHEDPFSKIIERNLDQSLKQKLKAIGSTEGGRIEAERLAASVVKRWVERNGGKLKLEELAEDFKQSYVSNPAAIYKLVAHKWVTFERKQKREEKAQVDVSEIECFVLYSVLHQKEFQDLFSRLAGEGAWKEMLRILRRHREQAQSGQERYERAINVLQTIKGANPAEYADIVLANSKRIKTDLLDASQLFLSLEQIEMARRLNLHLLHLSTLSYESLLSELKGSDKGPDQAMKNITWETRSFGHIYRSITGPVSSAERTSKRRRTNYLKKERRTNVKDKVLNVDRQPLLSKSPIYEQHNLPVVSERGTMKSFSYASLRDDKILLRPDFDHSSACFPLCCWSWVLELCFTGQHELDIVFLKNTSFLFISTSKQDVFGMHIVYEDTILLQQNFVSIYSLRQHLGKTSTITAQPEDYRQSITINDIDEKQKILPKVFIQKNTAMNKNRDRLGEERSRTRASYSLEDLTTNGDESIENFLILDAKNDPTEHGLLSKAGKSHLYNHLYYIFFDPLGSPTPRKHRCIFIFDAERLTRHLEDLPTPPAGFINKVDIQDPHHLRILSHKYSGHPSLTKIFN